MTETEYTFGKRGNRAVVEYRGRMNYRVHYNGREIARRFESQAGATGFARHLVEQGELGDPNGIVAKLEYADPPPPQGMTPERYRETLARLGLTVNSAGRHLGFDPRTSRRYAGGENRKAIPPTLAILLRVIEETNFDLERLRAIAAEETRQS